MLVELFPALFSHCQYPNVTVAAASRDGTWSLFLYPHLSARANTELCLLLQALPGALPVPDTPDHRGIGVELRPFTSTGFYAWRMEEGPMDDFAASIWDNKATPRCKHFLWLVHHECLPSAALLHHRNIIDSHAYSSCGGHEDQMHIFLHCPVPLQSGASWGGTSPLTYFPIVTFGPWEISERP